MVLFYQQKSIKQNMSNQHDQYRNNPHLPDDHYRHLQWGTTTDPSHSPNILPSPRSNTDYYQSQRPGEDHYQVNVDYSQVAAVQTGFKRLKSNQIEILKELRREYEVLRNTELQSGRISTIRMNTESAESVDDSASKSRSDARSSSYSRAERTRKRSYHKEIEVAALERKQMELMLNNSMKKIQQLLSGQIELKKTISDLKNKLESKEATIEEYEDALRKYKDEIEKINKALQDTKREGEGYRLKSKELISSLGSLQGQLAIAHAQIKRKDQRVRAFEEEIYLEKNKFCTLELDLKKYKLQAELIQRNHKEELSLLQRRITTSEGHRAAERDDQIRKLTKELQLKEERYRLLLNHFNQEKEEKEELIRTKSKQIEDIKERKEAKHDKEYIQQLEELIENLKEQKNKRVTASEEVLTSILVKVNEMNSKPNQDLVAEINMLKKELELIHGQTKSETRPTVNEEELQQKLKQLEQTIQDENIEKLYFIEDIKKIRNQLKEEKKQKEEAKSEVEELKFTLRKVEEQARKYSYELQTLRHFTEIDLTESRQQTQNMMVKSQQLQSKEQELTEVKNDLSRVIDSHRAKINEYEDDLKTVKRQLAEEQVKNYKVKEELQLKINLIKTEHEAELARQQQELAKTKKVHAAELNERINEKLSLQEKILEKTQELDQVYTQLNSYHKEKDNMYQEVRTEQDNRIKVMQQQHNASVKQLAQKLGHLTQLNQQHMQIVHRNSYLEQELIQMKRIVRHNRHINEGVDHLWSVKEAEYSNVHAILKELQ